MSRCRQPFPVVPTLGNDEPPIRLDRPVPRILRSAGWRARDTPSDQGRRLPLGLECVARGIERPQQLEELRVLGCSHVQGFLLGVPLPADVLGDDLGDDISAWTVNGSGLFEGANADAEGAAAYT